MSGERLAAELGAELPTSLTTLPEADLAALADLVATARREQAAALAEAGEQGLSFVPRLLRGPVRRVLFR